MLSENFKTDANKSDAPSLCQTQTDKIIAADVSEAQEKTFLEALETSGDAKNTNSIITSATQILKEGEHQWLNSEVTESHNLYKSSRFFLSLFCKYLQFLTEDDYYIGCRFFVEQFLRSA